MTGFVYAIGGSDGRVKIGEVTGIAAAELVKATAAADR